MNSKGTDMTKRITVFASVILAAAFIAVLIIDLFPRIRSESVVKGISEYKTCSLAPGSSRFFVFESSRSGFDSLTFFVMEGDATALKFCTAGNRNDIGETNGLSITSEMCSPEGKSVAVKINTPDNIRFKAGSYVAKITNTSSSPVSVVVGKNNEHLMVRLLAKTSTGYVAFASVCACLFIFAALSLAIYLKNGFNPLPAPEKLFLLAAIPLCAAFFILLPPWSTGDSEAHYLACYRLSNLFLGQSGDTEWMGRADDVAFFGNVWWNATPPSTGGYEIIRSNLHLFAENKTLVHMTARSEKMNYYSVFCYIPQTAALIIGRLIGFGPVVNCYLAKSLTALFYIVLCYGAIKRTPCGKGVLALCAILPSSLMMSGAFSYDPMVIITSLNFISAVLLLRNEPENNKALAAASIWAFILGAVKGGGYLILLPLLLIVPSRKKGFRHANKLIPPVFSLISIILFDLILPSGGLFQFGSKGNGFMTASFALENPVAYLVMTVKTYIRFTGEMISDLFGSKLCWGENTIPFAFSIVMLIVLLIAAANDRHTDDLKAKDIVVCLLVVFIALFSTPAMLLSWTPEGSDVILGIQGHYYLPVLPLIALTSGKLLHFLSGKTGINKTKAIKALKTAPYPAVVILLLFALYFMMRLYLSR